MSRRPIKPIAVKPNPWAKIPVVAAQPIEAAYDDESIFPAPECQIGGSDDCSSKLIICCKGHAVCHKCDIFVKKGQKSEDCVICCPMNWVNGPEEDFDVPDFVQTLRSLNIPRWHSLLSSLVESVEPNNACICYMCDIYIPKSFEQNYFKDGLGRTMCPPCHKKLCRVCLIRHATPKGSCQECHDKKYRVWKEWLENNEFVAFGDFMRRGNLRTCSHASHGEDTRFFVTDWDKIARIRRDSKRESSICARFRAESAESERGIATLVCTDHVIERICKSCVGKYHDFDKCPEHYKKCSIPGCNSMQANVPRIMSSVSTCPKHLHMQCSHHSCNQLCLEGSEWCTFHVAKCELCQVHVSDHAVKLCDKCSQRTCKLCDVIFASVGPEDDVCTQCYGKKMCIKCGLFNLPRPTWKGRHFVCHSCLVIGRIRQRGYGDRSENI